MPNILQKYLAVSARISIDQLSVLSNARSVHPDLAQLILQLTIQGTERALPVATVPIGTVHPVHKDCIVVICFLQNNPSFGATRRPQWLTKPVPLHI